MDEAVLADQLGLLSHGRAEVTLGRGSFTESFPLFGYRLEDYEVPYDQMLSREGALYVGSPETVAQKVAWAMKTLRLSRFHCPARRPRVSPTSFPSFRDFRH